MILIKYLLASLMLLAIQNVIAAGITLKNGDRLNGQIINESTENIIFSHEILGEITLNRSQISTIDLDTDPQLIEASKVYSAASEKNDGGLLNSGWLTNWKRKLSIGIAGAAGKSENSKISIGFTADYEDKKDRWKHKTTYYRYESEGLLSDNSFISSLNRDWLLPDSPMFNFAGGQLDIDEFKDWDERLGINGGIGYEFITTPAWRLLGRAGLGVNQTFGGIREETTLEGLLAAELDWKINSHQSLTFTNTLFPNFSDTGEFRNLSSFDWELDLNNNYNLGLKIDLSNEYDSLSTTNNKNDFKYAISVLLGL